MHFDVKYSAEADDDLVRIARQHPVAASQIIDRIESELSADPAGVSNRPSFPHRQHPKYQFWLQTDNGRGYVMVLWQYTQDEEGIVIVGVAMSVIED